MASYATIIDENDPKPAVKRRSKSFQEMKDAFARSLSRNSNYLVVEPHQAIKQGHLMKQGKYEKWKPRFLILTPDTLLWFDGDTQSRSKGEHSLADYYRCAIPEPHEQRTPTSEFEFRLEPKTLKVKAIHMYAESEQIRNEWVQELNELIVIKGRTNASHASKTVEKQMARELSKMQMRRGG